MNTARGKLYDRDVVAAALQSDALGGYAGNVWFPQPPPSDHPWRSMPWHGMTPHTSGTALPAQTRYAAGVRFEMWIFSVLQPDPTTGYPLNYVRDGIPSITGYADGSSTPSPEAIDYPMVNC